MTVKVANSRFMHSSLETCAALYQQLVAFSDFHRLGKWLVAECEIAQAFRQTEKLKELSIILCGIPIQEYQLIGQFYQAYSRSVGNPRKLFEDVIEGSKTFKSKALIALATLEMGDGNYDLGIKFCTEAIRKSNNVSTIVQAARSIAVIKSVEGFHTTALKDLERIAPLVRYASPMARCQYYNSCAVELCEAGRLEEARNISNIVLASPYAFAYPEWRGTGDEIQFRGYCSSRSILSLNHSALNLNNVLRLPLPEHNINSGSEHLPRSPFRQQASVTSLQEWKSKMVKEPNGNDEIDFSKMTDKEKLFKIIELSSNEDITDDQLDRILDAVIRITSKRT